MRTPPLRRLLLTQRELMLCGYGRLRFFSYVKDGLGMLRVFWFALHREQNIGVAQQAHDPLLVMSTGSFEGRPSVGLDFADDDIPIRMVAERLAATWTSAEGPPDDDYLFWYDRMLHVCGEEGFPVTEAPDVLGVTDDENGIRLLIADGAAAAQVMARLSAVSDWTVSDELLIPRPPNFCVSFPAREVRKTAEQAVHEAELQRIANNQLEWKERVSAIDARVASSKRPD
jgi:hypothetical protein